MRKVQFYKILFLICFWILSGNQDYILFDYYAVFYLNRSALFIQPGDKNAVTKWRCPQIILGLFIQRQDRDDHTLLEYLLFCSAFHTPGE